MVKTYTDEEIMEFFGEEAQAVKLVMALSKAGQMFAGYRDGKASAVDVLDGFADATVMMRQWAAKMAPKNMGSVAIDDRALRKRRRISRRIDEELDKIISFDAVIRYKPHNLIATRGAQRFDLRYHHEPYGHWVLTVMEVGNPIHVIANVKVVLSPHRSTRWVMREALAIAGLDAGKMNKAILELTTLQSDEDD